MARRERLLGIPLGRGRGLRAMLYIGWFHVSNESQLESIRTYRRIAVHTRRPRLYTRVHPVRAVQSTQFSFLQLSVRCHTSVVLHRQVVRCRPISVADRNSPEAMSTHVNVLEHGYRLRRVFCTGRWTC